MSTMAEYFTGLHISRKQRTQHQDNYCTAFSSKSGTSMSFPTFTQNKRKAVVLYSLIHTLRTANTIKDMLH
jgi:hypothetical protein